MRNLILYFLIIPILTSCSYSMSQEKLLGNWDVEIEFSDKKKNEQGEFMKFLSMHPLSNIFKGTNTIFFKSDGTLKMDKKFDVYPDYYFFDEDKQLLYLSFAPIETNVLEVRDDKLFVFEMEVNNNEYFSINLQADKEQFLVLKKK